MSRKPLVLGVALSLILAAVVVPISIHLPRWVEFEFVFLAWWVIWVGLLAWLLFRGHSVDDDTDVEPIARVGQGFGSAADGIFDFGCLATDGCQQLVVLVIAGMLLWAGAWLLLEFLLPGIAVLFLASIGGMLARAVNDTHGCEGQMGRSLLWAGLWATAYIGPLAGIVAWLSALLPQWR